MFIVWGKKHVYRNVGYVADFCPICRAPKAFLLRRVGLAGHVYYISIGEGELVGFERTCETCKTSFQANPHTYAAISKKAASFEDLQRQTYPDMYEVLAARLALEEKAKSSPQLLTSDERLSLIRIPFALLSPKVEKRFAATHIDRETGLTMLGTLASIIVAPGILRAVAPDSIDAGVLTILCMGGLMIIWQFIQSGQRFIRRQIIPVLAASLYPLAPTEAEMRAVLNEMAQLKHKMGSKLKLVDLMAHLQSIPNGGRDK